MKKQVMMVILMMMVINKKDKRKRISNVSLECRAWALCLHRAQMTLCTSYRADWGLNIFVTYLVIPSRQNILRFFYKTFATSVNGTVVYTTAVFIFQIQDELTCSLRSAGW